MDTLRPPSLSAALKARMDYLADRQVVLAGNIANSSTPGYLAQDLSFKPYLAAAKGQLAMQATRTNHMQAGVGGARQGLMQSARFVQHNGNAIRLDEQMVHMNQTKLDHQMITQIYAKQAAMQRLALGRQQ